MVPWQQLVSRRRNSRQTCRDTVHHQEETAVRAKLSQEVTARVESIRTFRLTMQLTVYTCRATK